eukprot:COSAG05_NODE_712_length_7820_cov_2.834089_3_plen_70_part_00
MHGYLDLMFIVPGVLRLAALAFLKRVGLRGKPEKLIGGGLRTSDVVAAYRALLDDGPDNFSTPVRNVTS